MQSVPPTRMTGQPGCENLRGSGDEAAATTDVPVQEPTAEALLAVQPQQQPEPSGTGSPIDEDAKASEEGSPEPDDEALENMFSKEALEEEKLLREQHTAEDKKHEEEKGVTAAALLLASDLDTQRFAELQQLLNKSVDYAGYVRDQMVEMETKTTTEAEVKMKAAAEAQQQVETAAQAETTTHEAQEEEAEPAEPTAAAAAARSTKKRKAASNSKRGSKKAKKSPAASAVKGLDSGVKVGPAQPGVALTPTQALLPGFNRELRDYQLKGVTWLISLYKNGINGILADQMGLGKTAQTIGVLYHLYQRSVAGPHLVVAPLSTLTNWVSEFSAFAPSVPTFLYHGARDERHTMMRFLTQKQRARAADFPIIITSYEILIADSTALGKLGIKYLVVDEGHRLKNHESKLMRELKALNAGTKVLLSGTPLQNNLAELWSLLNFLVPEVFHSLRDFEAWFQFSALVGQDGADKAIVAAQQRSQIVTKLHSILRPFMLRRLKSDVDIEVPQKQEIVLFAPMTSQQRQINQYLKDGTLAERMQELAVAEGVSANCKSELGKLSNKLMQMRKNCNHPDLITSPFTLDMDFPAPELLVAQCGKMQLLDRLLNKLHAAGHKVLIFSQMVRMLDLIDAYATQKGHRVCRLDGKYSVEARQQNIRAFNSEPESWLFLLSTRAGGLGINLTAADTVIIYDSDWNPQQDMQAMDRCHRIGQTKPVLVFRLATAHSVEGRMLKCAASKMALERLVIQKGGFKNTPGEASDGAGSSGSSKPFTLSEAELQELLAADYKMDDVPQSGTVSEQVLDQLLDRSRLLGKTGDTDVPPLPYPASGVGYEVLVTRHTSSDETTAGLQHINN